MNLPLSLVPCTNVPAPIAFAGVGIGVGAAWQLVPSLPVMRMPPELVLFIFLPPLLTTAAYALPLRAFRRNLPWPAIAGCRTGWAVVRAGPILAVAIIVVRMDCMLVVPRLVAMLGVSNGPTPSLGEQAVLGWSGMRGVVSLALALALPLTLDSEAYTLPDLHTHSIQKRLHILAGDIESNICR
ncbi:MAG: hypothetical protein ACYCY1_07905 [Sulfuriferula sp.]